MKGKLFGLPAQEQINTTMKPLEREVSNAELEKGEVVFDPSTGTLHTVLGKKHSKGGTPGGTPVNLPGGAFIFSDFTDLSFSAKDIKEMELKSPGKGKSKNTPAKILTKEINIKKHNGFINQLNKEVIDEISGNSAELMLQKNLEKLGQIAYKQEEKKQFPNNIPDISANTAPIYSDEVDAEITRSDQYKEGGFFLPKFQDGVTSFTDFFSKNPNYRFKKVDPTQPYKVIPKGYQDLNFLKHTGDWAGSIYDYGSEVSSLTDPLKKMGAIREYQAKTFPGLVTAARDLGYFNDNATEVKSYSDPRVYYDLFGLNKSRSFRTQAEKDKFIKEEGWTALDPSYKQENYYHRINPLTGRGEFIQAKSYSRNNLYQPTRIDVAPNTPTELVQPTGTGNNNNSPEDYPTQANYPNLGLTDYQKLRLAQQGLKTLGIKRYDPIRQHQESVYSTPEMLSAQPSLNQANQAYFNAVQNLGTITDPSQLIAANSQLSGNRLDNTNKIIGEIQNNNVNLSNQSRQQIASFLNTDAAQNRQYDKQYWDESTRSRQNYDNLRDIAGNKLYENLDTMLAENQAAQNIINSQRPISTNKLVRMPNGEIRRVAELPILPKKGFYGWSTVANQNLAGEGVLDYPTGAQDQLIEGARMRMQSLFQELQNIDVSDPKMSGLYRAKVLELNNLSKILAGPSQSKQ